MNLAPLWISLKVAWTATLLAMLAGVAVGYVLSRRSFRGRDLLDALCTLPMVLPPTVLGYCLIVALGRRGWLGGWLHETLDVSLLFTWQAAVLASAIVSFPLVFKAARTAFDGVDPLLEDAARTLGLAEWEIFLRVSLPLAWRGVLSGVVLGFARAFGEFGATLMVAGNLPGRTQTVPLAIYAAVESGDETQAAALVLAASLTCVAVGYASTRLLRPRPAHR